MKTFLITFSNNEQMYIQGVDIADAFINSQLDHNDVEHIKNYKLVF